MKKSKVYFEELKPVLDSGNQEEIDKKVLSMFKEFFVEEIQELRKTRNVKSDSALRAIFKEQNQKWNSLCDKCEAFRYLVLKRDAIKHIVEKDVLHGEAL